jgi:hypothetical protein
MTRRSRVWRVVAALFIVVNVGGRKRTRSRRCGRFCLIERAGIYDEG